MAFDETSARAVLMVQAFESADADSPLWTAEDRAWATRMATQSLGVGASAEHFLVERARHALQRLRPRQPQLAPQLGGHPEWLRWPWLAAGLGLLAGGLTDAIGAGQRINLLAPPVWAVVLWNLGVYGALAVSALRRRGDPSAATGPWRRMLQRWVGRGHSVLASAPLKAFVVSWARAGSALQLARLALCLHLAALGLAGGMTAGLYLRGLVLDYRAGWQSTFLEAPSVHRVLSTLLAPASALSGVPVPTVEALAAQQVPPGSAATASAAPWIHLYAATLALFVMLPRAALAAAAGWRARCLARGLPLPLGEPYFRRLLAQRSGAAAVVRVLPHGAEVSAPTALGLRRLLAGTWGDDVDLQLMPASAHGDEDRDSDQALEPGADMRVALFNMTATPEAEAQGRFVQRLRARAGAPPLLAIVDETAFRQRMGAFPERLAERRAVWQRWGEQQSVPVLCCDLAQPDGAAAQAVLASLIRTGSS